MKTLLCIVLCSYVLVQAGLVLALFSAQMALGAIGWTGLMEAAADGNLTAVMALVDSGADVADGGKPEMPPLLCAAMKNNLAVVSYLSDIADVNQAGQNGVRAIYMAATRGHLEAVQLLAEKGADVDRADKDGNTPALLAAAEGNLAMLQLLSDNGAGTLIVARRATRPNAPT